MLWFGLLWLTGCDEEPLRLAYADCVSEELDSNGTLLRTTYDAYGWPILEERWEDGQEEPTVTTLEYTRVAGNVVEALAMTGPVAHLYQYDAHGHLTLTDSNLEGDDGYTCTHVHIKDALRESSSCTNGVDTLYDTCDNPREVSTPDGRATFGYTYQDCRILNVQSIGVDAAGPYISTTQYFRGRPVSHVREQGGAFFASVTSWDCPGE